MPGRVLAERYRLVAKLGQGGMGSVWRAEHIELGTPAAVKLMDPAIASDEAALARFKREAQAAATLRSPHVVQIFDYGVDQDTPFIAMELLEGESLEDRLSRVGRLTPEVTSRILTHVSRAVSKAHEIGVVHRDLKPDNIFLVKEDEKEYAKVLDFGIAKRTTDAVTGADKVQTKTGAMLGTPFYMSPEQCSGKREIDHRTDIWAIAVLAYECLTGRLPFEADLLGGLVLAICMEQPPRPSSVWDVPAGFDEWFARGTAKDPDHRFQSAKEAARLLRALCVPSSARDSMDSAPEEELMASLALLRNGPTPPPAPLDGPLRIIRPDGVTASREATTQPGIEVAPSASDPPRPLSAWPIPLVPRSRQPAGGGITGTQLRPSAVTLRSPPGRSAVTVALAALGTLAVAIGVVAGWYAWGGAAPPGTTPEPPAAPMTIPAARPTLAEPVPLPELVPNPPADEAEASASASAEPVASAGEAQAPGQAPKRRPPRQRGPTPGPQDRLESELAL